MKITPPLPLRCPRILAFALLFAATTSGAEALMYCERAVDFASISDPVVMRRIEERLQAIPAMKNHQLRRIDSQFAIAWQDEEECKNRFRCNYLLLDIRNDEARVVFAFRGTGTILVLGPELNTLSQLLDDDYGFYAFETNDFNYVVARLPRFLGPVWVEARSSEEKSIPCAYRKYRGQR